MILVGRLVWIHFGIAVPMQDKMHAIVQIITYFGDFNSTFMVEVCSVSVVKPNLTPKRFQEKNFQFRGIMRFKIFIKSSDL